MMDSIQRGTSAERVDVVIPVLAQLAIGGDHRSLAAPPDDTEFVFHRTRSSKLLRIVRIARIL